MAKVVLEREAANERNTISLVDTCMPLTTIHACIDDETLSFTGNACFFLDQKPAHLTTNTPCNPGPVR